MKVNSTFHSKTEQEIFINSRHTDLDTSYANKLISKAYDTKFLGIHVDSTLAWKIHIEQITHKLSSACYAKRSVKPFMSQEKLKTVYNAYFNCVVNCGLISRWNSSQSEKKYKRIQS